MSESKPPLKPRETVEQLDRYIVGQADAKRAVAVAMRNRWRRQQLSEEMRTEVSPKNITRAATELAKQWRMDKALRQLEALLITTDGKTILLVSGTGDVISPTDGIAGIGSGGNFAIAAARALKQHSDLSAEEIVKESLTIAGGIDIYTNTNIVVEKIDT